MSVAHKIGSRWVIAACEDPSISVEFDFAVTLRRGDGLVVRIEDPFVLRASDGSGGTLDPEGDVEVLAPLLRIVRDELTGGVAHPDGALELTFASGTSIAVSSSEDFEAWELNAPDGLRLVSLPGGGLAEWSSTAGTEGGA